MIKPWLFEFFHQPLDAQLRSDPQAVHEHFRWYIDLWTRADTRDFEGIFFSEHHFGAAYSPSPNLLLSHVAARTTRLRLGVLGSVTPYATPWHIVEEIAMLDHLTDGRLEIGVVSGIPPELAVVGITPDVAAARHAEVIDVLDAALKDPVISHHGTQWNFDDPEILPRCLQQPSPPVWTAVRSAVSAEPAGRRGWKACGGFLSAKEIAVVFDAYRRHRPTPDPPESSVTKLDDSRRLVSSLTIHEGFGRGNAVQRGGRACTRLREGHEPVSAVRTRSPHTRNAGGSRRTGPRGREPGAAVAVVRSWRRT
ncbi:MAG: LLM class flavin-dependent oxidoreductase [Ilumatobacteraceae bacterium]